MSGEENKEADQNSFPSSKCLLRGRLHLMTNMATPIQTEDEDRLLVASITAEISRKSPSQCFIYKVPAKFRSKSDTDAYEPRIISIGPYHHGGDSFKMTEEHKRWYLHDLVSRKKTTTVMDLVKSIRNIENLARDCYAESTKDFNSDEFVKMMVFDGGFILELLYKYSESSVGNQREEHDGDVNMPRDGELEMRSNYINDPVLGATWMIYSLRKDLVLLENQIPFIVLEKLFELTKSPSQGNCSINELVINFFSPILPNVRAVTTRAKLKGKHILDLLRNHLLPSAHLMEVGDYPYWEYTQSATDLSNAGVKFRKKDPADGLLDITFTDGILEIPPFFFGESWTALLPNLIAFEQCRRDYTDQITSYVILMDSLINSGHDVKILRKNGIIDGLFHEDDKVAVEINNLFKGAVVDRFYYDGLCSRVNAYCKKPWHKWRAIAMRDYFNTPWSIIKFVAAVILLVLAATQTAYSIKSYSPHKE